MNDKLTPEIAALIVRDVCEIPFPPEASDPNRLECTVADLQRIVETRIESLAQQVQLLKWADEERARLRKALEFYRAGIEMTDVGAGAVNVAPDDGSLAEEALAASPTGYTERLEQALREINAEPEDHDNYSWIRRKVREALGVK